MSNTPGLVTLHSHAARLLACSPQKYCWPTRRR